MRKIYFVFLFCISVSLQAQIYQPIDTILIDKQALFQHFSQKSEKLEDKLKSFPVKNRKLIRDFSKNRKEVIAELTQDNYLITDDELVVYLNSLLDNIKEQNNISDPNLEIFLTRDTDPNAYSLGDGSLVFNLSLLNRLENEEELYSIMGHEVAHYLLDHLEVEFEHKMRVTTSKEYKKETKKIRRSRFNRFSKQIENFKEHQYGNSSERRKRELEADSLSIVLTEKIIKNPNNRVSALQKVDSILPSEIVRIDLNKLKTHFSTSTIPFNDEWTSGYDFSKYHYQDGKVDIFGVHKDSLRSHPETKERIAKIKEATKNMQVKPHAEQDGFTALKEKIRLEDVYAHYCLEEYGQGIYLILQLQSFPEVNQKEQAFYNHMLSLFNKKLHIARQKFQFKKYVDEPDERNLSEEYNLFLTILDNLNPSELLALSNKYQNL